MKRIMCVFIMVSMLAVLTGCVPKLLDATQTNNEEMAYSIRVENGEWFLVFKDTSRATGDDAKQEQIEPVIVPNFTSVKEMKKKIESGNFTVDEIEIIKSWGMDENGLLQICDLSSLYTASYPSTFTSESIAWYGMRYAFTFSTEENGPTGNLTFIDQNAYENELDLYSNFDEKSMVTVNTVSVDTDRNATVYEYINRIGEECKAYYYPVGEGSETLHVWEDYILNENATLPSYVRVFGQKQGIYFTVFIKNLKERPSVEWLSQFGIREYVETEVA